MFCFFHHSEIWANLQKKHDVDHSKTTNPLKTLRGSRLYNLCPAAISLKKIEGTLGI